jgi:hypothetical protein
VAEKAGGDTSAKRGLAARMLAPLGLFAFGYLAGRYAIKPARYAGSLISDRPDAAPSGLSVDS